jgi:hypothetical protein
MAKALFILLATVLVTGCSREKVAPSPAPVAPVAAKPSFVPPTAEQAYRLQDDCTRRGEAILKDSVVGPALTQEQVSRYNATTNRCYVRLEVHAMNLSEWDKHDSSTYLFDGQTKEMLGSWTLGPGGPSEGKRWQQGFGCWDQTCEEEKIAACMSGKECDPVE